jgi:hypothetical protein
MVASAAAAVVVVVVVGLTLVVVTVVVVGIVLVVVVVMAIAMLVVVVVAVIEVVVVALVAVALVLLVVRSISRPAKELNEPSVQCVPVAISTRVKRPGMKLTAHLCLMPSSRMVELYFHFLLWVSSAMLN